MSNENETPTPLTDAVWFYGSATQDYDKVVFASKYADLERQLTEANARADMQEELRRGMAHELAESVSKAEVLRQADILWTDKLEKAVFLKRLGITPDMAKEGE